jgi:Zn-finger nucleic acid-binding protein
MFSQVESEFRNCKKCRVLQMENMELEAIMKGFHSRQNHYYYAHKNTRMTTRGDFSTAKRLPIRTCFADITPSRNVEPFQETDISARPVK